jgi:beta-mannosidase
MVSPSVTRVRRISAYDVFPLSEGWEIASLPPGQADSPAALAAAQPHWLPAVVPGTVAQSLLRAGEWDFTHPRDIDAEEWWYRCTFHAPTDARSHARSDTQRNVREAVADRTVLVMAGLATVADVWLNGQHIAAADAMFTALDVDVSSIVDARNELVIRFGALRSALDAAPRPQRARWRTRLVEEQRLRTVRTTLLGRIPGWSPPVAPVGPWRPLSLQLRREIELTSADLRTSVDAGDGIATVSLEVRELTDDSHPIAATLSVGDDQTPLSISASEDGRTRIHGELRIESVPLWWPHTHGAQPLFRATVSIRTVAGTEIEVDCGRVGFRTVTVDRGNGDAFGLRINDVPVFCRGACWTTLDVVGLAGSRGDFRAALRMARDGGMNMLRVGGTMIYESDDFYDVCDEMGILVWQDWMCANMDYPTRDEQFARAMDGESRQLLARLQGRPSLTVLCGGSEVAQQAAMLGLPGDRWRSTLFEETLPAAASEMSPGVPYVPSTPWGGTHPFQVNFGVSHYYGVGAYLRPLSDARTSEVRFTSECLGFSNVPDAATIAHVPGGATGAGHSPGWKSRVPRDSGAPWDFEDVRDHYLELLYNVDARLLRSTDPARYLALSRVVTGEVMAHVIGEWRRPASSCRGALIWFYRDMWPGAGWGLIDSFGRPKAAYYIARRAMLPVALLASDEGLNGLWLHALNDTEREFEASIGVTLYRDGRHVAARGETSLHVPARGAVPCHADSVLNGFVDTTYAYRFGPPNHDLIVATLSDATTGNILGEAFHFPLGFPSARVEDVGLEARAVAVDDGGFAVTISTRDFAQSVAVEAEGFLADDSFFHLAPGGSHVILLRPAGEPRPLAGTVAALNAMSDTRIDLSR